MKKYLTNKIQTYVYLCMHHKVDEKIGVFLSFVIHLYIKAFVHCENGVTKSSVQNGR